MYHTQSLSNIYPVVPVDFEWGCHSCPSIFHRLTTGSPQDISIPSTGIGGPMGRRGFRTCCVGRKISETSETGFERNGCWITRREMSFSFILLWICLSAFPWIVSCPSKLFHWPCAFLLSPPLTPDTPPRHPVFCFPDQISVTICRPLSWDSVCFKRHYIKQELFWGATLPLWALCTAVWASGCLDTPEIRSIIVDSGWPLSRRIMQPNKRPRWEGNCSSSSYWQYRFLSELSEEPSGKVVRCSTFITVWGHEQHLHLNYMLKSKTTKTREDIMSRILRCDRSVRGTCSSF